MFFKRKRWIFIMIKKTLLTSKYSVVVILLIILLLIVSNNARIKSVILNNPVAKHIIAERDNAIYRKEGITLSFAAPDSFEHLSRVVEDRIHPDKAAIGGFKAYYEKAAEFYPNIAEVNAMLGFCNYYQGNKKEALDLYLKAVKLQPKYFWNNYNLAVLYLQNKDRDNAIKYLTNAIASDIDYSMQVTLTSSVYRSIWSQMKDPKARAIDRKSARLNSSHT